MLARAVLKGKHDAAHGAPAHHGADTMPILPTNARNIVASAAKHLDNGAPMASSARLAYDDAVSLLAANDFEYAAKRGNASLQYSVGRFHPDACAAHGAIYG